jgi:hypothetical protein
LKLKIGNNIELIIYERLIFSLSRFALSDYRSFPVNYERAHPQSLLTGKCQKVFGRVRKIVFIFFVLYVRKLDQTFCALLKIITSESCNDV